MATEKSQNDNLPPPSVTSCRKKKNESATFLEDVKDHIDEFIHASMDEHKTCFQKTIKKMFGMSKVVAQRSSEAKEVESSLPLRTTLTELCFITVWFILREFLYRFGDLNAKLLMSLSLALCLFGFMECSVDESGLLKSTKQLKMGHLRRIPRKSGLGMLKKKQKKKKKRMESDKLSRFH